MRGLGPGGIAAATRRLAWGAVVGLALLGTDPAAASPITDFIVYGHQKVVIGGNSTITGLVGSGTAVVGASSILAGGAGVVGDVRSGDDVTLKNYAYVTGSVTTPGTLTLGAGASVGQYIVAAPDLPTLGPAPVFSAGGASVAPQNNTVLTLLPDSYGSIGLGGTSTLNLSAGDYYFTSLSAGNGLDLNIDLSSGDVHVFVTGTVNFGRVDMNLTGGTAADVTFTVLGTGDNTFRAAGGSDWAGTVYAPNGGIHLGSGGSPSQFVGQLWSGTIVDIEHSVIGTEPPPSPVPEPASMLLLATGLLGAGLSAARRKRARRLASGVREAGAPLRKS